MSVTLYRPDWLSNEFSKRNISYLSLKIFEILRCCISKPCGDKAVCWYWPTNMMMKSEQCYNILNVSALNYFFFAVNQCNNSFYINSFTQVYNTLLTMALKCQALSLIANDSMVTIIHVFSHYGTYIQITRQMKAIKINKCWRE